MKVSISSSSVSGRTKIPPSKSYTHRGILVGALSDGMEVLDPLKSADTRASMECAESLGAEVDDFGERLEIEGTRGEPEVPEDVMGCGNSGTTLRLFTGASALCEGTAVLTGDESLRQRPNGPLLSSLEELGARARSTNGDGTAPLVVEGPIDGGETTIDGTVSSQFISSLLFTLPLTEEGGEITVEDELKSRPYVDITLDVMEKAGVSYEETENGFSVEGDQSYDADRFQVPGDFSSASYPLALGALHDGIVAENLFPSAQGDSVILDLLERMGTDVEWDRDSGVAEIESGELTGIRFDAADNPDLAPTVAVLGAAGSGETEIVNAEHLRYKETDRLEAVATELSKMGADVEEGQDYLKVDGDSSSLEGAEVDGRDDHRIVMALAVAASVADGETVIETAESVNISYPGFFRKMSSLGLDVKEI
ncbi:MAG: 3-phosphoshikimate 1-carboxyvinyltransferase [Candidatus Nanohaloarchaea archaeon]